MSIESKTEKPFIEETFASFFFCSLQNQRGLNFLHLDEESSLRVCIVNAGPSSFQTITTTDPKQQATIVIDFSKAGGVRFTAPPEPVPGFDLFVDEAGPVITLVQTAYYWSWFAGEYLAVQLPGQPIEVFDTASRTLTAIPGTALSSGHWQNLGWQPGSHRLVIAAGPNHRPGPAQLAYWQPGATRLRIATIRNLAEASNLQTGNILWPLPTARLDVRR